MLCVHQSVHLSVSLSSFVLRIDSEPLITVTISHQTVPLLLAVFLMVHLLTYNWLCSSVYWLYSWLNQEDIHKLLHSNPVTSKLFNIIANNTLCIIIKPM